MPVRSARPSTGGTSWRDRLPNRLNENGRETQERIFTAAERLFAEHGIDAVSTRDIIDAAGVNGGSIHYHFGTREQLIVALVERRAGYLGVQRDRYLDELEATGEINLRSVVDVLVRPTAEFARDPDGRYHAGFIVAVTNKRELMPIVRRVFDQYTNRYLAVLATRDAAPRRHHSAPALWHRPRHRQSGRRPIRRRVAALDRAARRQTPATRSMTTLVAAVTDIVVAMFAAA